MDARGAGVSAVSTRPELPSGERVGIGGGGGRAAMSAQQRAGKALLRWRQTSVEFSCSPSRLFNKK